MNDKLSKFLIVIFLTLLIWAWAYFSQEKYLSRSGSLEVSPTTDPGLLVTFKLKDSELPQTRIPLNPLTFKGSPTKISEFLKRYNLSQSDANRERLDFFYNPQEHGQGEGSYSLDILELLKKDDRIHEMALTLEACNPAQVDVNVELLELKRLPVECLDENGFPIQGVIADPAFVDIYTRPTYNGPATVTLSPQQREIARKSMVSVKPYVQLGVAGVIRESEITVKVTLQSEERLKPQAFQPGSIGIVMSPQLAGKYSVVIANEAQLTSTTQFNATDEAMDAYKKMKYHLLIEVLASDEQLAEIPPRPVIYNFPHDYFKNGEIVELTPPKPAIFKLVPISPGVD
jgi:hypothetical protein